MTAPAHCVLDGTTGVAPRLPDDLCADFGGLNFQDDIENPPYPDQQPSAWHWKQISQVLQRVARTAAVCQIDFTGGASAATVDCVRSMSNPVMASGGFEIVRTATGTYEVRFASGVMPPRNGKRPDVVAAANGRAYATQSGNVVTVYMYNTSNALTDSLSVNLSVFGGA